MQKEKLPKPIKAAVSKFVALKEQARETGNAANREKTQLKNVIADLWASNGYPIGTFIHCGGVRIMYEAADRQVLDTDAVLKLYDNEKISRETFLRMISISTAEARKSLGGDLVTSLTKEVAGEKADIRIEELPIENAEDEFIVVKTKRIKVKNPKLADAVQERGKDKEKPGTRRIKIRGKK